MSKEMREVSSRNEKSFCLHKCLWGVSCQIYKSDVGGHWKFERSPKRYQNSVFVGVV